MPDVDAVFQEPARLFRARIKRPADRSHLESVIRSICENPRTDDDRMFAVSSSDNTITGYADGKFVVIFRHLNNWTVSILAIAYDKDFIPWDDDAD